MIKDQTENNEADINLAKPFDKVDNRILLHVIKDLTI